MDWLKLIHGAAQPTPPAVFGTGDEVRVWYRILEQGKERLGQFEGTVIRYRGSGHSKTFTVRRVTYGEGVERVFPVDSKTVSRIEVLRQGKVKRSRLYYLRAVIGKTRIASASDSDIADRAATGSPATKAVDGAADKSESAVAAAGGPAEGTAPRIA